MKASQLLLVTHGTIQTPRVVFACVAQVGTFVCGEADLVLVVSSEQNS